jgi:Spy/CpxP family protein refolding chaperone
MTYGANASGARCRQALCDTPGDPAKSAAAFTKLYNYETQPKRGLARVAGDGMQQSKESAMTEDTHIYDAASRGSFRSLIVLVGAVLFIGFAALASMAFGGSEEDGWGSGFWHHGHMGRPLDLAQIVDRADKAVRHLAIEIDATPDQQAKLQAIVKTALKDLLPMRDQLRAGRAQARELLTGPEMNRDAIEKFRAQQMALVDSASKRIAQAVTDAAQVLTPEQREAIVERFPLGGFWNHWHRG